eukprot:Ihof_evm1s1148 gene=Ihof_evmTU1s1148
MKHTLQTPINPTPKRRKVGDPLYGDLPKAVLNEMDKLGMGVLPEPPVQYIESYVRDLMTNNGLSAQSFDTNWDHKLKNKVLMLDNPPTKKKVKMYPTNGPKVMSSSEKKANHIFDIPPESIKYALYIPLHTLWLQYMSDLLGPINVTNTSTIEAKLLKGDYHGCLLTVTRSKCTNLIGTTGICLQETENTFKIITQDNRLKVIPKINTVFTFTLDSLVITLYGNHFM